MTAQAPILMSGGYIATLDDISAVRTPLATATHKPIPHRWFLDQVISSLAVANYEVTAQNFGLMGKEGQDFFGVLTLNKQSPTKDYAHVLGIRNSHRCKFSASTVLGTRVMVCDNLAFNGSGTLMSYSRKHTSSIMRDLPQIAIDNALRLPDHFTTIDDQIQSWKDYTLGSTDNQIRKNAADFLLRAMTHGAVNSRLLPQVWQEFNRFDGAGGHACFTEPTMWSLYNAFTEAEKSSTSPIETFKRTSRLTGLANREVLNGTYTNITTN